MVVSVLCVFLTVPWVDLQSVIVAFPGHTFFLVKYYGQLFHNSEKCIELCITEKEYGNIRVYRFNLSVLLSK